MLVLLYILTVLIAATVIRIRAGLGFWDRLRLFGPGGVGLDWLLPAVGKGLVWPVILVVWLVSGRPEPRVVFGEKAEARRAARHGS